MKRTLAVTLMSLWSCLAQHTVLDTGVIDGRLVGEDGPVIAGGGVTMRLVRPTRKAGFQRTEWAATSDASGAFRFEAVPSGDYLLCAYVPHSTWLNPCEWGLPTPAVTLSDVRTRANLTITLRKGVAVTIRIEDPNQLLPLHEGRTAGARLLLGVGSAGFVFRFVPVVSQDASGRDQRLVIPYDTPVNLVVRSTFFQVIDAMGAPLRRDEATLIPLAVQSGQQVAPIRFTVTGTGI
jgi:hypothetical protein